MKRSGIVVLGAMLLAASAWSQMSAPQPGPEQKKLDIFVGSWTLDGDLKPGPMGAGGKMTEIQKCEWMEGGFFLVCRADFKSAVGNASGLSLMGYSAEDKGYTYREFNSLGEFMESKGAFEGDIWTWSGEDKMGDIPIKGRFTMKFTSPTSYSFTYEISQDGSKWTTAMDGKATKSK